MTIPTCKHWAIITCTPTSVFVSCDNRAQIPLGHGYFEDSEEIIGYEAFVEFEKFEKRVLQLTLKNSKFHAIDANPLKVEMTTTIKLT
jgi:hypothetical protein